MKKQHRSAGGMHDGDHNGSDADDDGEHGDKANGEETQRLIGEHDGDSDGEEGREKEKKTSSPALKAKKGGEDGQSQAQEK